MFSSNNDIKRRSTLSQAKQDFKINFIESLRATLASLDQAAQQSSETQRQYQTRPQLFSAPKYVFINGIPLNKVQLVRLHLQGYFPPAGYFWYDSACRAWGKIGGPCLGILPPNINLSGGGLQREACSPNTTHATVNRRLLHKLDYIRLIANNVPVLLGHWWINADGQYGLDGSLIPIGRFNIHNMVAHGVPGAEAFSPTQLDKASRAQLEKELHKLLAKENTPPFARTYHNGWGTHSYYRPSATATPPKGKPQQSDTEARTRREYEQQARRERDEKLERERREREERFRREQQDREETRKRQQREREARARREEAAKRQRAETAKEAEAQHKVKRWKEYNRAWEELKNSTASSRSSRNPRTSIPWPTDPGSSRSCQDVSQADIDTFLRYGLSVDAGTANVSCQMLAILKIERVRWHPDRVRCLFCAQVDEDTMNKVTEISQIVNNLYAYEQAKGP